MRLDGDVGVDVDPQITNGSSGSDVVGADKTIMETFIIFSVIWTR